MGKEVVCVCVCMCDRGEEIILFDLPLRNQTTYIWECNFFVFVVMAV